jgi:hypothetical protein
MEGSKADVPSQASISNLLSEAPRAAEPSVWTLFYVVGCVLGIGLGAAIISVLILAVNHH